MLASVRSIDQGPESEAGAGLHHAVCLSWSPAAVQAALQAALPEQDPDAAA